MYSRVFVLHGRMKRCVFALKRLLCANNEAPATVQLKATPSALITS